MRSRRLVFVLTAVGVAIGALPRASAQPVAPLPAASASASPAPSASFGVAPAEPEDITGRSLPLPKPLPDLGSRPPLVWKREWSRVGTADVALTVGGAGITVLTAFVKPSTKPWRGGVLFDESARNAIRFGSPNSRGRAADVSDVLLSIEESYPILVDALGVAYGVHESKDVAFQIAFLHLEAQAINAGIQGMFVSFSSRERPYGRTCGTSDLSASTQQCTDYTRYRSFFSGHTSGSFASASTSCVTHLELDLYGGGAPDVLACIGGYTVAAVTGTLRIASDNHYASDVLTGLVVGTTVGLAVPLLHYEVAPDKPKESPPLQLGFYPMGLGLGVVGVY